MTITQHTYLQLSYFKLLYEANVFHKFLSMQPQQKIYGKEAIQAIAMHKAKLDSTLKKDTQQHKVNVPRRYGESLGGSKT
jgi:hypothetical protein